jgi:hypothetical protein
MKENNAIDMRTSEVINWITSQAIKHIESVDASKYTAPLKTTILYKHWLPRILNGTT